MATITEDYVSFETAKLLKEKGFDEGCSFVINAISKGVMPVSWPTTNSDIEDEKASLIALPTLQMAMKWLREEYEIDIIIFRHIRGKRITFFDRIEKRTHVEHQSKCNLYLSYEQACEAAIKYCLENLI